MRFLLDTNVCIQYLRGHKAVLESLETHDGASIFLCSVVRAELLYGALRSSRVQAATAATSGFMSRFVSWTFNDAAAERHATLRLELGQVGFPIGPADLQIAAIALVNDAVLVTHNTREFLRVPGLRVEDWQTPGADEPRTQ